MPRCLLLGLALVTMSPRAAAEEAGSVVIPGESRPTATRIDEARKLLAARKVADAIALLQGVIDSNGDHLVALSADRSISARLLCQQILSSLRGEDLVLYRRHADAPARRLLEQASAGDGPLFRLVADYFCTRAALEALDRLGDAAFLRGDFEEAERSWALIAPLQPTLRDASTVRLVYPDPPAEQVARARAKQLLARLFADRSGWDDDLGAFRKQDPKAEGKLAGRSGLYADILAAVARERSRAALPTMGDWTTFAGSPTRGGTLAAPARLLERLSQLGRSGPTWRFSLEDRARQAADFLPMKKGEEVQAARRLAFHPVVVGHLALVADSRYLTAYDLRTGKATLWYDVSRVTGIRPRTELPTFADLRHSLTVAEGCVFARFGAGAIRDIRPTGARIGFKESGESVLVSLALQPNANGNRQRWLVRAVDLARKEYAVFEGAPVVRDGRVYIAATRFEGDRVITAIHCYPAHPEDSAPALLWRTDVCETRELLPAGAAGTDSARRQRHRHHMLTLAGSRVVYCSHSGAVVALDARTGQRAWALRYPRRDLTEPEDDPALRDLAPPVFDAGRLFVAPVDCDRVYCLDPLMGTVLWERERLDVVHLLGVGQGRLIFSTWSNPRLGRLHAGGLRAVRASDGSDEGGWALPDDGGGLTPFGRGLLIGDLVLWPTARRPFGVFAVRQVDGKQPDNPTLLHRIPSGNLLYANDCLVVTDRQTLYAFVPPEKRLDDQVGKAAVASPTDLRHQARVAAARGELDLARTRYETLLEQADLTDRDEVRRECQNVLLAQADRAVAAGQQARAAELFLTAAGMKATDRLAALLHAARSWSAAGERARAAAVWEAIRDSAQWRDQPVMDASGLPQRAGWIAARAVGPGRPPVPDKDAARAALERLASGVAGKERSVALADLARAWSEQGCPRATRLVHQRQGETVAKTVHPPGLTLPLHLDGEITLGPGERFLPAAGCEGLSARCLYSARGALVFARSRRGGEMRWRTQLPFDLTWAAGLGSLLLVAGPEGAAALDAGGQPLWTFPLRGSWTDFHRVGLSLILGGPRRLIALDVLTGETLWQRQAPGASFAMPAPRGRFQHIVPVGEECLLIQASGRCLVLDAQTGAVTDLGATPLDPWPRAPLVLGEGRLLLVPDSGRVQMLDTQTRRWVWTYTLPGQTVRTGEPPLVVASAQAILLVTPHNIACRLDRLDPMHGKPLWSKPLFIRLERLDPASWLVGEGLVYHVDAGRLTWRSLLDGKIVGERAVDRTGHRLARSDQVLLLWHAREPALRFRFRWLGRSLQWQVGPWPDGGVVFLACLDARSGELMQRINLDVDRLIPRASSARERSGVFPRPEFWRDPQGGPGLVLVQDDTGVLVACGNRIKALHRDGPSSSK